MIHSRLDHHGQICARIRGRSRFDVERQDVPLVENWRRPDARAQGARRMVPDDHRVECLVLCVNRQDLDALLRRAIEVEEDEATHLEAGARAIVRCGADRLRRPDNV
jgi:hypothetical protein